MRNRTVSDGKYDMILGQKKLKLEESKLEWYDHACVRKGKEIEIKFG